MPSTAYIRILTGDSALTANWRYAAVIPASEVFAAGASFRIRFSGPASGSTLFQSVYAGRKGGGAYDFDETPQPITVGGQSSFFVNANQQVWSDPVSAPVTVGHGMVICYDAVGGTGRAYRNATVAGHTLYYLSGLGGTSNAVVTKTGYSAVSGLTAVISGIEVAASVGDFSTPLPPEEPPAGNCFSQDWGIKAIDGDQIFARGDFIAGQPGKHLHINLNSTPTSGKAVYLWSIEVTPDADTAFSLRSLLPDSAGADWVNIPAICNANFTTPETYATARLKKGFADAILGGLHSVGTLKGGQMKMIHLPHCPLVKVYPSFTGACLALHSAGVGATVTFHWQELPVSA